MFSCITKSVNLLISHSKLLHAQPSDTVHFAAEFFTVKNASLADFQLKLKAEVRHLQHKKAKSFIEMKSKLGIDRSKDNKDIIDLKKMHIQPLAIDIEEPKPVE